MLQHQTVERHHEQCAHSQSDLHQLQLGTEEPNLREQHAVAGEQNEQELNSEGPQQLQQGHLSQRQWERLQGQTQVQQNKQHSQNC